MITQQSTDRRHRSVIRDKHQQSTEPTIHDNYQQSTDRTDQDTGRIGLSNSNCPQFLSRSGFHRESDVAGLRADAIDLLVRVATVLFPQDRQTFCQLPKNRDFCQLWICQRKDKPSAAGAEIFSIFGSWIRFLISEVDSFCAKEINPKTIARRRRRNF